MSHGQDLPEESRRLADSGQRRVGTGGARGSGRDDVRVERRGPAHFRPAWRISSSISFSPTVSSHNASMVEPAWRYAGSIDFIEANDFTCCSSSATLRSPLVS